MSGIVMTPLTEVMGRVSDLLRSFSYRHAGERELQEHIESILAGSGIAAVREYRLGSEPIDFFLPGSGVGIEVKVAGSLSAATRQLFRYAAHPDVGGLVLATPLRRLDSMPPAILGKPILVALLPGAF